MIKLTSNDTEHEYIVFTYIVGSATPSSAVILPLGTVYNMHVIIVKHIVCKND